MWACPGGGEFGKQVRTIGFDIAKAKVGTCQRGTDPSPRADG